MDTENASQLNANVPSPASTGSALRVETWECRACGQHVPCVVSLTYELTGYPEIDAGDHYRRQSCLAREPKATDWKRMPNNQAHPTAAKATVDGTEIYE